MKAAYQQLQDRIKLTLQDISSLYLERRASIASLVQRHVAWFGAVVIVVAIIGGYVWSSQGADQQSEVKGLSISTTSSPLPSVASPASESIKVDVSGAVRFPGVKELKAGDRVEDALAAAGGTTDQADMIYVAQAINLAQKVADGEKIFIPAVNQTVPQTIGVNGRSSGMQSAGTATSSFISINRASQAELESLPGIGETYARRIIDNRPYASIDDLCQRKLFRSQSTCDDIRPFVTL